MRYRISRDSKPLWHRLGQFVFVAGAIFVLSACEANNQELTEPQGALDNRVEVDTDAPSVDEANRVAVELVDYDILMPEALPAGPTLFVVKNQGETTHNFEIEGQGIEQEFETPLAPNDSETMSVVLEPGEYRVYCPVGNHAEQGMSRQLTVVEAPQT